MYLQLYKYYYLLPPRFLSGVTVWCTKLSPTKKFKKSLPQFTLSICYLSKDYVRRELELGFAGN